MKKLVFAVVGVPAWITGSAMALPFQPNPDSFASWLSQQKWKGGAMKVKFSYLQDCYIGPIGRDGLPARSNYVEYYCKGGYAKWSDPTGSGTCEVRWVRYINPPGSTEWKC